MSLTPVEMGPGRRRHKPSQDEPLHATLGQSFNAGELQRSSRHQQDGHSRGISTELESLEPSPPPQFLSKLPPAVATVPQEDARSYVHSKRVTHYLIGSTLGEGSFAKVKEGFHSLVGEKVAVKVIDKKKTLEDPYVSKNFRREAKLLQMVHHPNILQLLEVVETDNSYYLITELCSGGELMQHIYKQTQLTETETRKYMRQMVSAVDHLHKAGIIHRDLKVENLLLDSRGNIKIIDFGLSNEEYVVEESKRVHCSTQCGSPAYAAPELLGHKSYGPEVDIWSLGVNMYAMLTGCLPYTVQPFNITALHAKMLENKMNPIPSSLSRECNDLLHGLLTSDPALRIKMPELMAHPWMTADGSSTLKPHPFPSKFSVNDINEDIVEHMVHVLKLKEREADVTAELLTDRACAISAIYHLLLARLDRYMTQKPKVKYRKKSRYEPHVSHMRTDDDSHSTVSYTPRATRGHNPNRVHLQPMGQSEGESRLRQRRKTLPSELLKDDIDKIRQCQPPPAGHKKHGTLPRTLWSRPDTQQRTQRGCQEVTRPTTHLNPVRPHPARHAIPTSISHPKDLNKFRQELNNHAWSSQVPSQASLAGSRTASRVSSRQPSAVSRHASQTSISHRLSAGCEYNDIEFHEVETVSVLNSKHGHSSHAQKKIPHNHVECGLGDTHFPSLAPHSGPYSGLHGGGPHGGGPHSGPYSGLHGGGPHGGGPHSGPNGGRDTQRKRSSSYDSRDTTSSRNHRTNGHWSPKKFEIQTEHSTSDVVDDLLRIVERLNISCTDQKGNTVYLKCHSVKFQVHVGKEHNTCQLDFQWLQGGSQGQYEGLCKEIFLNLST